MGYQLGCRRYATVNGSPGVPKAWFGKAIHGCILFVLNPTEDSRQGLDEILF
ncbi:hypothetical protein ASPCADRAFT_210272, partial [Aspergillus carbonarius ITEM 5010]